MKRTINLALILLGAIVCLLSCQKAPELTVSSPTNIDLSVDGSSGSITFTANRDWRVTSSDSWVIVSPSSGEASDKPVTVSVRCDANTTYDDRTATVTIRMEELFQTVAVRQPANLGIVLPAQSYELASNAKTLEISVQANVQYAVSSSVGWIKQMETKGLTTNKLTFSIEDNKTFDTREGIITIKQIDGTLIQTVSVKQNSFLQAVDLGLSVKWANVNIGAYVPEQYGDYFAWGETETKNEYNYTTYKWSNGEYNKLTKYCNLNEHGFWAGDGNPDGKITLDPEDDPASVIWGGKWRMPTKEELKELTDLCAWTQTTTNGVNGYVVESKTNNNGIFIPASGYYRNTSIYLLDSHGYYWSSSLRTGLPNNAYTLYFESGLVLGDGRYYYDRCIGLSIRPVTE